MQIYYGIIGNLIDVTEICLQRLRVNDCIIIPSGDGNRASFFTDPVFGVLKKVYIEDNGKIYEFDYFYQIEINMVNNTINVINTSPVVKNNIYEDPKNYINMNETNNGMSDTDIEFRNRINNKLVDIHYKLILKHGKLNDELPEQKMSVRYLTGKEKVLELGGNVGRNTLVIASILEDDTNLVSLECDPIFANQLRENRDANNYKFHVECSALSNRKLIQIGIDTKPSEVLEPGYNWVNTITLNELKKKYNIEFDTLVLDCEGAFYYILIDMPEILSGINLIIMENDYNDRSKKNYVDFVLQTHGFYRDYVEPILGHRMPCEDCFFEVWKRNNQL